MTQDPFGFIGTVIDNRHRIDELVGEGGFGMVYRGFHLNFEQPIAVKCLKVPPHFTTEARELFLKRFREEGSLLAKLSEHPSIVRVYDFGIATNPNGIEVPYLALEWLEGQDLGQLLEDREKKGFGTYTEADAIELLRPAIDAFA